MIKHTYRTNYRSSVKDPLIEHSNYIYSSSMNNKKFLILDKKPTHIDNKIISSKRDLQCFIAYCMSDHSDIVYNMLENTVNAHGKEYVTTMLNKKYNISYVKARGICHRKFDNNDFDGSLVIINEWSIIYNNLLLNDYLIEHLLLHGKITIDKIRIFKILVDYGANVKFSVNNSIKEINLHTVTSMSNYLKILKKNKKDKKILCFNNFLLSKLPEVTINLIIDYIIPYHMNYLDCLIPIYYSQKHIKMFKHILDDLKDYCINCGKIKSRTSKFYCKCNDYMYTSPYYDY